MDFCTFCNKPPTAMELSILIAKQEEQKRKSLDHKSWLYDMFIMACKEVEYYMNSVDKMSDGIVSKRFEVQCRQREMTRDFYAKEMTKIIKEENPPMIVTSNATS